ncbi:MAG: bifunctional DNA-formamidopyrimidine glycosylase/DNA-(apurinic or apyrimidinic site) lyase [candidate division Zixibacteria bacterium]|nr:bifunctional DNA-formamidopyrimidine glycosylase/DNA-(apurinic or apyrimidinic site) lyase [candidate division Zixibacteria bacterium]
MPELPEVETVCRGLRDTVIGKRILGVTVNAPAASIVVSRQVQPQDFAPALFDRTILTVNRRGKNILIGLSGGVTLWVHLKMTGHFFYEKQMPTPDKHDLVVFQLSQPEDRDLTARKGNPVPSYLRFNDYRRFGRLRLYTDDELWQQKGLKELGPEPLEISAKDFVTLAHRRPRQLKAALLDQSFIAGVGNIYADESLWAASLHPKRLTSKVPAKQLAELHRHIQRLLRLAIRRNGTSVDSYSNVNGEAGSFQRYLKVYGREGEPCRRCGGKIVRKKLGARSAHYCPGCQRPGRVGVR